jgi:hypothetical protein
MITLSLLSSRKLAQLDSALDLLNEALEMLLDEGAVSEREGVDLVELSDALGEELERRAPT